MLAMRPNLPCDALPKRAGVGLKAGHYRTILETTPDVGFFEIHAENYMGAGGPPHRYLSAIRERYPLSLHGVGLSIGADRPLDREHLARLKRLIDLYAPALFSEHLAWSSHDVGFLNDLLPLPYTNSTLARVAEHIDQVQDMLGRQMLLENPSTYLAFAQSNWAEPDFIAEIQRRTGCGLLLDVNNVQVACTNQEWDPIAWLDAYPMQHVQQIHLAGFAPDADEAGRPLLIDAHDCAVAADVWDLFAHVIERTGPVPTLIEWDANVPEWPVLAAEAAKAERVMTEAARRGPGSAFALDRRAVLASLLLPALAGVSVPAVATSPIVMSEPPAMPSRKIAVYYAWDRSAETAAPLEVIEDRFPALFESRRMLFPRYAELEDKDRFDQGIAGFLDHIMKHNFAHFVQLAGKLSGHPVIEIERGANDGRLTRLSAETLGDCDTLIVIGFDSLRTSQQADTAEIDYLRTFLDNPDHLVFLGPHHDIGETDMPAPDARLHHQTEEFLHHGDRTIPPRQGFGGFARSLLAGLGIPVENRFGLHPAMLPDGTPAPIDADQKLDRLGLLARVSSFNLHPHLPHMERGAAALDKLDVLARQSIDRAAPPHPFTAGGRWTFDALLQSRAETFAGTLLVGDATLWSSTAGGVESLERFWTNIAQRETREKRS